MRFRGFLVVFLTFLPLVSGDPPTQPPAPQVRDALDAIHADALREDLKFIASDELQGRDSPSAGLDRAADYIAGEFRKAGLEPGANGSYFQNASMLVEEPDTSGFALKLAAGSREFTASPKDAAASVAEAVDLKDAPVFKLDLGDQSVVEKLTPRDLDGKVVMVEFSTRRGPGARSVGRMLRESKAALVITVVKKAVDSPGRPHRRLVDSGGSHPVSGPPRLTLAGEDADRFYAALKPGASGATAMVHIAAPRRTPATLRNVIGILRGSDAALRDSYVFLTAHYDHLGVKPDGPGDRIYNGANDDGSGTVSVMEVARALGQLPRHPRRSIVFMTFFGEEEGLIGSEYYVHHPLLPLANTVADLNLEQVGRTDATDGRQISNATLTGFDYSDLTSFVQRAGKSTAIKIYKNSASSDAYFSASDNFSFAEAGVPAETLCVAFDYADYHAVGDEWQKIDYDNMAKVDRAIALAMFLMADSDQAVRWNVSNPKTAPYVKAREKQPPE
jgi:hypothetical protein